MPECTRRLDHHTAPGRCCLREMKSIFLSWRWLLIYRPAVSGASIARKEDEVNDVWRTILVGLLVAAASACHVDPMLTTGSKQPVGGTIAGVATTEDRKVALQDRRVSAI